jgi:hypothetical protein
LKQYFPNFDSFVLMFCRSFTQSFATGLFLFGTLNSQPVLAQVGISPMVIELQESNGQAQGAINVINNTEREFRARIYAQPFTYEKDQGFAVTAENASSLVPYLKFSPRELSVPAGVTRRVRLNIQLPAHLPAGEYRTVIFTENLDRKTQNDRAGATTTITTRIGVTLFVRRGNGVPQIDLVTAEWDRTQQKILLTIQNVGSASAYPTVAWQLKQGERSIANGQSNPTGIIPASARTLKITPSAPLTPGTYHLKGEITWGKGENRSTRPFDVVVLVP